MRVGYYYVGGGWSQHAGDGDAIVRVCTRVLQHLLHQWWRCHGDRGDVRPPERCDFKATSTNDSHINSDTLAWINSFKQTWPVLCGISSILYRSVWFAPQSWFLWDMCWTAAGQKAKGKGTWFLENTKTAAEWHIQAARKWQHPAESWTFYGKAGLLIKNANRTTRSSVINKSKIQDVT